MFLICFFLIKIIECFCKVFVFLGIYLEIILLFVKCILVNFCLVEFGFFGVFIKIFK